MSTETEKVEWALQWEIKRKVLRTIHTELLTLPS